MLRTERRKANTSGKVSWWEAGRTAVEIRGRWEVRCGGCAPGRHIPAGIPAVHHPSAPLIPRPMTRRRLRRSPSRRTAAGGRGADRAARRLGAGTAAVGVRRSTSGGDAPARRATPPRTVGALLHDRRPARLQAGDRLPVLHRPLRGGGRGAGDRRAIGEGAPLRPAPRPKPHPLAAERRRGVGAPLGRGRSARDRLARPWLSARGAGWPRSSSLPPTPAARSTDRSPWRGRSSAGRTTSRSSATPERSQARFRSRDPCGASRIRPNSASWPALAEMSGTAMLAGMRALAPGVMQRTVEARVVASCIECGGRALVLAVGDVRAARGVHRPVRRLRGLRLA